MDKSATTEQAHPQHEERRSSDPLKALLLSIAERGEHIPFEERARIPRDFAQNLDQYLYGDPITS